MFASPLPNWNASIEETEERNGAFRATLHEVPLAVVSRDPEHDLCHAMVEAGLGDGPNSILAWECAKPDVPLCPSDIFRTDRARRRIPSCRSDPTHCR